MGACLAAPGLAGGMCSASSRAVSGASCWARTGSCCSCIATGRSSAARALRLTPQRTPLVMTSTTLPKMSAIATGSGTGRRAMVAKGVYGSGRQAARAEQRPCGAARCAPLGRCGRGLLAVARMCVILWKLNSVLQPLQLRRLRVRPVWSDLGSVCASFTAGTLSKAIWELILTAGTPTGSIGPRLKREGGLARCADRRPRGAWGARLSTAVRSLGGPLDATPPMPPGQRSKGVSYTACSRLSRSGAQSCSAGWSVLDKCRRKQRGIVLFLNVSIPQGATAVTAATDLAAVTAATAVTAALTCRAS